MASIRGLLPSRAIDVSVFPERYTRSDDGPKCGLRRPLLTVKLRDFPPLEDITTSSASRGTTPCFELGDDKAECSGARKTTIEDPSGVHTGSIHKATFSETLIGSPLPSALAFHKCPPDSS
ncbi:MAG: hypothetical protein HOM22_03005, partial [Candidatus Marinimicrobia bacterium]|nr:hypothetical protein [Candidatus Neomarinimicrobiota bacterium]